MVLLKYNLDPANPNIDPFKNYHAATELINRCTDSLIVCTALTFVWDGNCQ